MFTCVGLPFIGEYFSSHDNYVLIGTIVSNSVKYCKYKSCNPTEYENFMEISNPVFDFYSSANTSNTSINSEEVELDEFPVYNNASKDYEGLLFAYTRYIGSKSAFVELIHKAKGAPKDVLCLFFDYSICAAQANLTFHVAKVRIDATAVQQAIESARANQIENKLMQLRHYQLKLDYGSSVRSRLKGLGDEPTIALQDKTMEILRLEIDRFKHLKYHQCDTVIPQFAFKLITEPHIDEHPISPADWVYKWVTSTIFTADDVHFRLVPNTTSRIVLASYTVPDEFVDIWEERLASHFTEVPAILSRSKFQEKKLKGFKTSYMVMNSKGIPLPIECVGDCQFEILSRIPFAK